MPLHVLHMQEERLDTARRLPFLHSRHTLHTHRTIRQLPRFTSNTPLLQVMRPEYARHKKGLLFIYNKVRQPPCAPRSFSTIPALTRCQYQNPAHVDEWRDGLWAALQVPKHPVLCARV
jgi:hypothetical protein